MAEYIEHPQIWLMPVCGECDALCYERTWCQDKQEKCSECGKEWVKYTLAPADPPKATP